MMDNEVTGNEVLSDFSSHAASGVRLLLCEIYIVKCIQWFMILCLNGSWVVIL